MIDINPNYKKIGISLSGGADSALLAYLILKETDADIYFTTQIRMWKTRPWQRYVAQDVVAWFKEHFSNNIEHVEGFIPPEMEEPNTISIPDEYGKLKPGNRIILRAHNEWVAHTYKLDAWYAAVSKNPKEISGGPIERYKGVLPLKIEHMGIDIYHPFVYTTKDWIVKQYYENNIEDLFNITRSCKGEFEELDYKTYIPGQFVPTCEKCFWCKEREWAIEKAK